MNAVTNTMASSALFNMDGVQWVVVMPYMATTTRQWFYDRYPQLPMTFTKDCGVTVNKQGDHQCLTFTFNFISVKYGCHGVLPRNHLDVVFNSVGDDTVRTSLQNIHAALGADRYSMYRCRIGRIGKQVIASFGSEGEHGGTQTNVERDTHVILAACKRALGEALEEMSRVLDHVFAEIQLDARCTTCSSLLPLLHNKSPKQGFCERCWEARNSASGRIARAFRRAISDPSRALCRKRLTSEFSEYDGDFVQ